MPTLYVVPCSAKKSRLLGGNQFPTMRAADAYTGQCFVAARDRLIGKPWVILSAKYGILLPDDQIEPYDVRLPDNFKEADIEAFVKGLRRKKYRHLKQFDKVICLGGKTYCRATQILFPRQTVICPVQGLSIGRMIQQMRHGRWMEREPVALKGD